MTDNFWLALTIGNALVATGWLLTRWRQRVLAARERHAMRRALQQRGSDLPTEEQILARTHSPSQAPAQEAHWSDICRSCHHERRMHHRPAGCLQPVSTNPNQNTTTLCNCLHFQP